MRSGIKASGNKEQACAAKNPRLVKELVWSFYSVAEHVQDRVSQLLSNFKHRYRTTGNDKINFQLQFRHSKLQFLPKIIHFYRNFYMRINLKQKKRFWNL